MYQEGFNPIAGTALGSGGAGQYPQAMAYFSELSPTGSGI